MVQAGIDDQLGLGPGRLEPRLHQAGFADADIHVLVAVEQQTGALIFSAFWAGEPSFT
jgi:hypothetical protein